MKKIIALVSAFALVISLASCGKVSTAEPDSTVTQSETAAYTDPNEAFSNATLINNADETNIYYLYADGTYKEVYKGSNLEGKWKVENSDRLVITMNGMDASYYYSILQDANGSVTGITQMEGRSFTIVRHSVPDNISVYENTDGAEN